MLATVLSKIPRRFWSSITRISPTIAYYHIVSDKDVPHVKHLYRFRGIEQFKKDIDVFCKSFVPVSLHDLLSSVANDSPLPVNTLLLTFDDGFSEIYHVIAPILMTKGIPATFFLTTACIDNQDLAHHNKISLLIEEFSKVESAAVKHEVSTILAKHTGETTNIPRALFKLSFQHGEAVRRIATAVGFDFHSYLAECRPYLTSDQVHKLIDWGFTIGSHSVDHPVYSSLSLDEQLYQTRTSTRFVRQRFSLTYGAFAFPHGDTGVSRAFFQKIVSEGDVDISFGTRGMVTEPIPRHFQRFSMENSPASAEQILSESYGRGVLRKLVKPRSMRRG